MPWVAGDAEEHTKLAKTDRQQQLWAEVANDELARCAKAGSAADVCEGQAIRVANDVIKKMDESAPFQELLLAALIEHATFKSALQALMRSADAVAKHSGIPQKVKRSVEAFRSMLRSTWKTIASDAASSPEKGKGATAAASASEAGRDMVPFILEALGGSHTDEGNDNGTGFEFVETGELVEGAKETGVEFTEIGGEFVAVEG